MQPQQFAARSGFPPLSELKQRFDAHMAQMAASARPTPVNRVRAEVLAQCRAKAGLPPGVFQLTVPTGGGTTLSSMAFALDHAAQHGQRRIIYAIPYTSIIEQTADVFARVLGADSFIEHHSNFDADPARETHHTRLACENWDAPLVITTNVQLFESLFASKTARCRKLHNLVNSVIVLDEAQLLPPDFLDPIVDVLALLTRHYGVSVVLCTATQPALDGEGNGYGFKGLPSQKIIADPNALYQVLERVTVHLPPDLKAQQSWDDIAQQVAAESCALAIVNTKKSAYELWSRLPKGALHLSSLMCGQHRSDLIGFIRTRLAQRREDVDKFDKNESIRIVSTQLIEAGVDVDLPVVFRALAGLDSIAQAAGRCNREGLQERGQVHVFVPPVAPPKGILSKSVASCIAVLHQAPVQPLVPSMFSRYFTHLYAQCERDERGILPLLRDVAEGERFPAPQFRTASERFKLIDEQGVPLIVHYRGLDGQNDQIDQLLRQLEALGPERWLMRKLQRYTVSIFHNDATRLCQQGDIRECLPGLYVQAHDLLYHAEFGVNLTQIPGGAADWVV
jgi:CRISPR-associated endonuclease/helicase Cas3